MTTIRRDAPLIGVVGTCSSGKTTLIAELKKHGVNARHIAQEHSYVKDMWRRLTNPDLLIFLHVSYPVAQERRPLTWTEGEYEKQINRLIHAHEHADLHIDTDKKTPAAILEEVVNFLQEAGIL